MPPELRLVYRDDAGTKFWSYRLDGTVLTVLSGAVGGKTKTTTTSFPSEVTAHERITRLVAAKVDAGYFADELPVELRRFSEVAGEIRVAGNAEQPDDRVWVFTESVRIPHGLWMDYRTGFLRVGTDDDPIVGILVRGDLHIDGCLVNWEDDYGPFLQVHGNLTARSIATGGSQIHVAGNLVTEDLVGVYNHGCITVGGDLTARTIATEHLVEAKGATTGHRYEGWGAKVYPVRAGVVDTADPHEPKGVFAAALVREGAVDLEAARRRLAAGKPIARPTFSSVRDNFRAKVGKKAAVAHTVRSMTLAYKDMTVLPDELFTFANLEKLDLTHNKLRTLPERIGELTALRELRLRGNGLQTLPESIGELTRLEHLDLEANCVVGLPATLARCAQLKTVNLTNNPYSYVRSSFGRWRDVRLMWTLPECLFELPALEHLTFNQTFVRSLPARPFISPRLAPMRVRYTLLLDHDPAAHPQLTVDVESSRERATDYIRFWFDTDYIRLESFRNPRTGGYDFTDVTAMLGLILRIAIPTAAPYDEALETFDKQAREIVRDLHRYGEGTGHARHLFTALGTALDAWELDNPLIAGLREIFRAHT